MPAVIKLLRSLFHLHALAALVYLVLSALLRLTLWWQFGRAADVSALQLLWIVVGGVLNDGVTVLYLLLPYSLYLLWLPQRWHTGRIGRRVLQAGFALFCFALLYLMATEYFFFEEFDARFNLVAVDYLIYPTEVIGNIRDTYPVGTVMSVAALLAIGLTYLWRARLRFQTTLTAGQRTLALLAHSLLVTVVALGLSTRTLATSSNRVANEITINGLSSFFEALRTSEIDYHHFYHSIDSTLALNTVAQALTTADTPFTELAAGRLTRQFPAHADGLGKLHVVVLVEESFGAEFSGTYGATESDTPRFDELAKQGLLFRNTYASGTRTARGLEAITASFPPIPSESILHRPGNAPIATWGSVLATQGYHTSFLYGGYGYFDNMNQFYGDNGFEVVDRNQIDHPKFANIWGVSDADLFDKVLDHLDAQQQREPTKPMFAMVMSTSNHKPFTFPEGIPGIPAQGGGRHAGVKYADYALGQFIDKARSHAWFKDTVFVIVADHGARVYGKVDIPLNTYRIPLLVYSPAHIQAQVIDTLTGQIDIAPTVLGLLGMSYQAPFFGQDVLHHPDNRLALFSHNHDVALLKEGQLTVLGLNQSIESLHYDAATDSYSPTEQSAAQVQLTTAFFQTGYELFEQHHYQLPANP